MAEEYSREKRWTRTTIVDPFVFGTENELNNKTELELNNPDPRLVMQSQIESQSGLG